MGGTLWRILWTLALVGALPIAHAADLRAELWFAQPPALEGPATLRAGEGVLLLEGPPGAVPVSLSWSSARYHAVVFRGTSAHALPESTFDDSGTPETRLLPAGTLSGLTCSEGCRVVLEAAGDGLVGLAGEASGALRETARRDPLVIGADPLQVVVADWSRAFEESRTVGALAGGPRTPLAGGNLTLRLWNVSGTLVEDAGATREVWAGRRDEPLAPGLAAPATRYEIRNVTIDMQDARLDAPAGTPSTLLAPRLHAALTGTLDAARADGWAEADGRRVEVEGVPVRARGDLLVDVGSAERLDGPAARPSDALAARQAADLGGSGALWVDGQAVRSPAASAPAVAATVVGLAAAGVAALLLLKSGAWVWLYTRVTRAQVLENATRRAIYDRVRAHPGVHVSELSRNLGVGRVVLQHHLRMLEAHHLLVPCPQGRVLAYFPPGHVPSGDRLAAEVALKDATRRRVLDAARGEMGATQAEIADETRLSQRLVSYHLARLEAVGLVQGDGGRPQRFRAAEETRQAPETSVAGT